MDGEKQTGLFVMAPEIDCGCSSSDADAAAAHKAKKVLSIDLVVIDLTTCKRCVPTGDQLRRAVHLLEPVAEALGIELKYRSIVVQTPQEAKAHALLSSPTIRLNGRDIDQDIRESLCESCRDLTANSIPVDCREWHYRGRVYNAAPLPLLIEAIMCAMLDIDRPPVVPAPIETLPENLQRYFDNKKPADRCC